ncbi:sporulation protein [Streptomyces sp. NPDC058572]|uniref:sporulation protein n=1 Tax=Streptomyces sp. NPDC058572 TaxID=3346546 RepID=UPI003648C7BC
MHLRGAMQSRQPNHRLVSLIERSGSSASSLAVRVRQVAERHGEAISCTHVDVGRWKAGTQARGRTPYFIAEALSERLGERITLADIGMEESAAPGLELALNYPEDLAECIARLGEITKVDAAHDPAISALPVGLPGDGHPALSWLLSRDAGLTTRRESGRQVGKTDVEAIKLTNEMFMGLDFRLGGGNARASLVTYYREAVQPLLHSNFTDSVGRALFAAAAEVTQLLGWTAYDIGKHGLARRYFVQSLRLSQTADDRMMGARILSNLSHQANFLGRYSEAAQLARAAQQGAQGKCSGTVMALLEAMEARALAGAGEAKGVAVALRAAEQSFKSLESGTDPAWISYFDEAELHGEFAHCFRDLNDFRQAEIYTSRCIELTDPAYARTLSFLRLVQADTAIRKGDVTEGLLVATNAVELAGPLKSARYMQYVDKVLEDARVRASGSQEVEDFAQLTESVRVAQSV